MESDIRTDDSAAPIDGSEPGNFIDAIIDEHNASGPVGLGAKRTRTGRTIGSGTNLLLLPGQDIVEPSKQRRIVLVELGKRNEF